MIHARIDSVSPDAQSATLVADVVASTTLPVDDVIDFAEDGGWLVIGNGAPQRYISSDDDLDTITLIDPVSADAGDVVAEWDPDRRAVTIEHVAWCISDDPDIGGFEAVVPESIADQAGGESLRGASVVIDPADNVTGDPTVVAILGRTAQIDPTAIRPARVTYFRGLDTAPIPATTWTQLGFGSPEDSVGFTESTGSEAVPDQDGRYFISLVVNWEPNSVGTRRARLRIERLDGSMAVVTPEFRDAASATGDTSVALSYALDLMAGERLTVQVWHDASSSIAIRGDAGGLRTAWQVSRMGGA